MQSEILIVDDEPDIRALLGDMLVEEGFRCREAGDSAAALRSIEERPPQVVILDIWLRGDDRDGLSMLKTLRERRPEISVVTISGDGEIKTAVESMRLGAVDFIEKPLRSAEVARTVGRAVDAARRASADAALRAREAAEWELVGVSPAASQLRGAIDRVARTDSRVLIAGPAGSGKELAARMIHAGSRRAGGPFVALNCAAIAPDRMETELFGSQRGDGRERDPGTLERADGGTLLLDEVTDMPLRTQSKIVRVLLEQTFAPAGGTAEVSVDVRVVAATSKNMESEMRSGTFRPDLYYRLNVVPIAVPPLKARREDIPILLEHFMARISEAAGMPPRRLGEDAVAALQSYAWPGNVRQLRNVAEWVLIMAPGSPADPVPADALPPEIVSEAPDPMPSDGNGAVMGLPLREARENFERAYLLAQIDRFGGNISRTARFVGMERSALHRKLKTLGVSGMDPAEGPPA